MTPNQDQIAPDGKIWECQACGKRNKDRYGGNSYSDTHGWDASCVLNSVLVDDSKKDK